MLNKRLPPSLGVTPVAKSAIQPKAAPVAPPVYRPQPTPRVLQTKQATHKGPTAPIAHARISGAPQVARPTGPTIRPSLQPGAPAVKSVAPPVYRPNPGPHVLQRRTSFQPTKAPEATPALMRRAVERGANLTARHQHVPHATLGQRQPVQMKAQGATASPRGLINTGVVQRTIVINSFGEKKKKRTFTVKTSKSERSFAKSADFLIEFLEKKNFKSGWIGHLRNMVGEDKFHVFSTVDDLVNDLAQTFPRISKRKKRKRELKNEISNEHKTNLQNIESKYSRPGKKIRRGSFVGMNKLTEELSKTKVLKQNIKTLESTSKPTKKGKSLILDTGNIFQSQLSLSLSNLDNDVKGAYLEGNYVRVNGGLGNSEGIRQQPFVGIPTRLKKTVVYGDGAYKKGEIVKEDLSTFENVRLGENTVPSEFRHMLVEEGTLNDTDEFNPVGIYALSEIPGATKGIDLNNQLMDQNSFKIFEEVKKIDNSTVIGRNFNYLPPGTNTSTVGSYIKSFNDVRTNFNKTTQNEYHKQNFYIARSTFGPFYNEKKETFVPSTPPGSPFDQGYDYDK